MTGALAHPTLMYAISARFFTCLACVIKTFVYVASLQLLTTSSAGNQAREQGACGDMHGQRGLCRSP